LNCWFKHFFLRGRLAKCKRKIVKKKYRKKRKGKGLVKKRHQSRIMVQEKFTAGRSYSGGD
jgi:hypothetical protein